MSADPEIKLLLVGIFVCSLVSAHFISRADVEVVIHKIAYYGGIGIMVLAASAAVAVCSKWQQDRESRRRVRAEEKRAARAARKRAESKCLLDGLSPTASQFETAVVRSFPTPTMQTMLTQSSDTSNIKAAIARAIQWQGDKDLDLATEKLRGQLFAIGTRQCVFVGRTVSDSRVRVIEVSDNTSRLLLPEWSQLIIDTLNHAHDRNLA
jgi:hypothetical protein